MITGIVIKSSVIMKHTYTLYIFMEATGRWAVAWILYVIVSTLQNWQHEDNKIITNISHELIAATYALKPGEIHSPFQIL